MNGAAPIWMEHLRFAAVSDIGMRRLNNQDAALQLPATDTDGWHSRGHLFLVADGMGAHAAGELASRMAVQAVAHHYQKHLELSPPEALLRAVQDANSEIYQRGQANAEFHNMGTTCSALLLLPQGALVGHVGDSRVYRLRDQTLEQLTFDHSLVWEMQATGHFRNRDLSLNVPKNVITRSLGPQPNVQVDLEGPFEVQPQDSFLMCTDGLMARIQDDEIGLILAGLPLQDAVHLLVDLANVRGGPDNITVIAIEMMEELRGSTAKPTDPLVVRPQFRPQRRVHPVIWMLLGLSALLTMGLVVAGLPWLALLPAGIGVFGLVAAWQQLRSDNDTSLSPKRRLGKGPYVSVDCPIAAERVIALCESVRELLSQYQDTDFPGRSRILACLEEAESKVKEGEFSESFGMLAVAVQVFAEALRRPPPANLEPS